MSAIRHIEDDPLIYMSDDELAERIQWLHQLASEYRSSADRIDRTIKRLLAQPSEKARQMARRNMQENRETS